MAIVKMTTKSGTKHGAIVWGAGARIAEYDEELSASGNGDWILIPAGAKHVAAQLDPSGPGSGKLQAVVGELRDLRDGNVQPVDWPSGVVAAPTQDVVSPACLAIRQVNVSGTTKLSVKAT